MSYQEKRSFVTVMSGLFIFAIYFAVVWSRYQGFSLEMLGNTDSMLRFWATVMLIFVPVTVVGRILFLIGFTIVYRITAGEDPPDFDDERDKIIELKVNQISQALFAVGFVGSMIPIVAGLSVTAMFVVILASGLISEIIGETARILMYRRGF